MDRTKNWPLIFSGFVLLGFGTSANADFTGAYIGGAAGLFTPATVENDVNENIVGYGFEDNIFTKLDIVAGYGVQQGQIYYGIEG